MVVMAEEGARQYRQELTADPRAFALIRRTVTAHIRYWGWTDHVGPAVMCVTEMLANVRDHAGSPDCVLILRATPSELRIVVSDRSPVLPVVRQPDWCSENGRGMWLLGANADTWGAEHTAEGKNVWVAFTRPTGAAPVI